MMVAGQLEGEALLAHPLADSVVSVVEERGYEQADVEEFLDRAGVSRREFDRHFSGKSDVILKVMEAFIADFRGRVGAAFAAEGRWPASLRAAAYETVRWMADNPKATRFGAVSGAQAGNMLRVRREELYLWCASLIDVGREEAPDPAAVPAQAALLAVGAVAESLRRQQEGGGQADPVAFVPGLMYAAVRPYLGEDLARAELSIPPPPDLTDPARRGCGDARGTPR